MSLFLLAGEAAPALPEQPPMESGFMQMLLIGGVIILSFYFIIFRPEGKRRKAEEAKRAAMKKGDKVTSVGGIVGVIVKVNPETVVVRMVDGARIEFMKAGIADVQPVSEEESQKLDAKEE
jgi:preprotein translocase subunit YajC